MPVASTAYSESILQTLLVGEHCSVFSLEAGGVDAPASKEAEETAS